MKIKGQTLVNDNIQVVVLPRLKDNLVFKFKPVINFDEFDNYVKVPEPPSVTKPGGVSFKDFEDKDYRKQVMEYATLKMQWLFLESIAATPDLEWDGVKRNDSTTWHLAEKELQDAQLTFTEVAELKNAFQSANSLDESKLEKARASFLAIAQGQ